MMEPEIKARELVASFMGIRRENLYGMEVPVMRLQDAQECSKIAVDEIRNEAKSGLNSSFTHVRREAERMVKYWEAVKTEIEKL